MDCDLIPFMTLWQFFLYEKEVPADWSIRKTPIFLKKHREVEEFIRMYGEKGLEMEDTRLRSASPE